MSRTDDYTELIEKARCGEKDAQRHLAATAKVRLEEYVYRLTLQQDLTQDIVQESILEMFKVFEKLKRVERFWPWLYGIAFNKVRSHYGRQWRHKVVSLSASGDIAGPEGRDGLAEIVTREFKEIVVKSMDELPPQHRAILTMRCYDQMAYSEIAKVVGCSEFGARAMFYRAKRALAKKLGRYGLGKSSLVLALAVFGKITASGEAAAANLSVTTASLKVGLTASLAVTATSKTALITVIAAGIVGGTSAMVVSSVNENQAMRARASQFARAQQYVRAASANVQECWYFFPEGPDKPLMMRLMGGDNPGGDLTCRYLQNGHATYFFDKNTVRLSNHRFYNADLSVRRLPTDNRPLSDFISQVEGHCGDMEYLGDSRKGLLVILKRAEAENSRIWRVDQHRTVLEEQCFQSDCPGSAKVEDNRDAMHKRGWTCFTVSGRIDDKKISGTGRIPFYYEASRAHYPWLDIRVGEGLRIVDAGAEAGVYDGRGNAIARYEGGALFEGLAQPWMGLHAIDAVRRDAAARRVWFETKPSDQEGKVKVELSFEGLKLVYEIDLAGDVIDRITFLEKNNGDHDAKGEVRFSYLMEIPPTSDALAAPRPTSSATRRWDRLGNSWLVNLASGEW